jgi:geranylgeranyl pyrophosphate synthase
MGAVCAGANKNILKSLNAFGENIGLAFQIVDDILDLTPEFVSCWYEKLKKHQKYGEKRI